MKWGLILTVLLAGCGNATDTAAGNSAAGGNSNSNGWSNPADDAFYLVFEIAADDEAFDAIKPTRRAAYVRDLGAREPGIGEESWIYEDRDGSLRFRTVQNRKVIDLHLQSADAPSRKSALIELGRIVADRLN